MIRVLFCVQALLFSQLGFGLQISWEEFLTLGKVYSGSQKALTSLSSAALLEAKILKINYSSIEIETGTLVFTLIPSGDPCRQNVRADEDSFYVYTICFREPEVLIEYVSDFER